MNNTYKFSVILLLLICNSTSAQLKTLGFHMKSKHKKKVSLNFSIHNNLIVLPIQVNKLDTLNFVLDTGVGYTLLTDPAIKDSLGLSCFRYIDVAGTGTEKPLKGCVTSVGTIRLKNIICKNHTLIVLEEDVLRLSSYAGVKIHGLIGYDIFSKFVVKINYLNQSVEFINPKKFTKPPKNYEVFPLEILGSKPYIRAETVLEGDKRLDTKLVLDLGAGHSLSLDNGSHPEISIPSKVIEAYLGMTLNGLVKGVIGRVEKFRIGKYELEQVITSFPDSLSLRYVKDEADRNGNVGAGVLKRFHLILDYPNKRVFMKPNRKFREPFEFNTSGINIIADLPDYRTYRIAAVRANSPAEQVGLRVADEIISVDNQMASTMTLNQLYKAINKREDKKTVLFIKRQNRYYLVEVIHKNPL